MHIGQTIYCKDGRLLTIMKTIRLRNRKKHTVLHVRKTRSGGLLLGDVVQTMTAKALKKLAT